MGRLVLLFLTLWCATCTRDVSAQTVPLEQQLLAENPAGIAADSRELGDPARGAFLFHSPGVGCFKCHATAEPMEGIGPDLAAWKQRVDDVHLVESVLRPSATIEPAYQSRQLITTDGRALVGIEISRSDQAITLQTGIGDADRIVLQVDDVELEKPSGVSLMPAGQVNALRRRQDFLDLIAYLVAIRDGGRDVARELQPSKESLRLSVPAYESDLDHRGMIEDWNDKSLQRGEAIYRSVCQNCHGTIDRPGSLPTSLRFAEGKFKFGSDPHAMYQTLTFGGGMMVPQAWMVPQQKYDVIHFIREHFLRDHNPDQYFALSEDYLTSLPNGSSRGPEPEVIAPWTTMDYGPMLITTIQFGDSDENIAQKVIAVRVDEGPGGVARGSAWIAFEHDTLRMAAAWTGDFIDWNGIQFNGRHGVHASAAGPIVAANPTGPGWADPVDGSLVDDERIVGRDGRRYGPLPTEWGKFRGLHRFEDQVILNYTVGSTKILERPASIPIGSRVAFVRTLNLGSRNSDLEMVVMTPGEQAAIESLPLQSKSPLRNAVGLRVDDGGQSVTIIAEGFGGSASLVQRDKQIVLRFKKGQRPLSGSVVISDVPGIVKPRRC